MVRTLMILWAVALILAGVTNVVTPAFAWNPPWPVRLGLCGAGVLLALGTLLVGRPGRRPPADGSPDA
jgi:hypothetical protein